MPASAIFPLPLRVLRIYYGRKLSSYGFPGYKYMYIYMYIYICRSTCANFTIGRGNELTFDRICMAANADSAVVLCIRMANMSSSHSQVPAVGDKPNQPKSFIFPQREFGKTSIVKRLFQRQWFERWSWLHYDDCRDLSFCFTCIVAYQNNHLRSVANLGQSFISTGFSNWKDATAKFNKHQASRCHQEAVLKTITLPLGNLV